MTLTTTSPRSRCPNGRAAPSCARSWWRRCVGGDVRGLAHFSRTTRAALKCKPCVWAVLPSHLPALPPAACPLQTYVDPDEIFQQHQKTCSLDEVFANGEPAGRQLAGPVVVGGKRASDVANDKCMHEGSPALS